MKTQTEISLRVAEDDAKAEATLSMPNVTATSSFSQIRDDEYATDEIPTLESNSWILDGTKKLVDNPAVLSWGVWSEEVSDENGNFNRNSILTAVTKNNYSTAGFTVTFGGDTWPKQTVATWYRGTTVLASHTDVVTSRTHMIDRAVDGFNKITVEFVGTDVPYRRVKIAEIDFGVIFVWTRENILSATALEEVNPTSSELSVNTLQLSIQDDHAEFNMLNPAGVYAYLLQKQQLRVTEYVNGIPQKMGFYYLKTWANSSSVTADFKAQDIVGVFDGITYKKSPMWTDASFSTVIASILSAAGFQNYSIDNSLSGVKLSGYIPVTTVREALHQACFAGRAGVLSKRDGTLLFTRLPSSRAAKVIEKSQKFGDQTIMQNDLINSVAVTAYRWAAASDSSQLYSANLTPGTYEATFDKPAVGLSISGGTIMSSGINYAIVSVSAPGTVTITGRKYEPSTTIYTVEAPDLIETRRSQATVDKIYLISPFNAKDVAQFVYDDYQRRIMQKFSVVVHDEAVGDKVDVDTMLSARKTGIITRMNMDLAGGFTAKMEVRG